MSRHKKKNRNHSKNQNTSEKEVLLDLDKEASGEDASKKDADKDASKEGTPEASSEDSSGKDADKEAPEADASKTESTAEGSDGAASDNAEGAPAAEVGVPADSAKETASAAEDSGSGDGSSEDSSSEEKGEDPDEEADSKKDDPDEDGESSDEDKESSDEEESGSKDGKKKVSREALREKSENERNRREARRRRRIRQQVTAYVILIIILALLGFGIYYGAKTFTGLNSGRNQTQEPQEPVQEEPVEVTPVVTEPEPDPGPTVADLGQTPAERFDEVIDNIISGMTLEEKIQGLMFVTPESITGVDRVVVAGDGTKNALTDFTPGGIVYSSKNVTSKDQFSEMLATTVTLVPRPMFLAVAETGLDESGLIRSGIISPVMTPAQAAESGNVEEVVTAGSTIGDGLRSIGVTVDFAPMADLSVTNGGVMSQSTYGNDAASVTPYVTGMADGLSASGVVAAYKFFPSLAASSQNPANGRAVCDRSIEDFRNNEFQVWLSAINAGAKMIQMSNVIYPSIDEDSLPSSLSEKTVTGVLRDELKYTGVIISGPLNDGAVTAYYTPAESAVMALKSGCDMIYASPDPKAAVTGIEEAVGSGVISEERINDALARIYSVMYADSLEQFRIEYEANAAAMGVDLTGVSY